MLIAAIVVGLLTGYYFGVKPGAVAAAAALVLLIIAGTVPGAAVSVYLVIGVGLAGVYVIGERLRSSRTDTSLTGMGKKLLSRLWRRL